MTTTQAEIRKDSRLLQFAYLLTPDSQRPKDTVNLCSVIGHVVWHSVFLGFVVAFMLFAVGFSVLVVFAAVDYLIHVIKYFTAHPPHVPAITSSGWAVLMQIIGGLILFGAFEWLTVLVHRCWKQSEIRALLGAYLRAKKEKVCPMLKIV